MALPEELYTRTVLSDTLTVTKIEGGYLFTDKQGAIATTQFVTDAQAGTSTPSGYVVTRITSDTTADEDTTTYTCDTSGNDIELELDPTDYTDGFIWRVKKIDAANTLTIVTSGSETIDGDSDGVSITLNQACITIQYDGTNFIILN